MKTIGAVLTLLTLCLVAEGSNCRVVTVRQAYHHDYVAPVVAHYAYPAYSVGYNPAGELAEAVKLLIEDNKAMRQELIQAIKAAPGVAPWPSHLPKPDPLPPLLPLKAAKHPESHASCVSCHDSSVAKGKGGGFEFYKDGVFLNTPDNVSAMYKAVVKTKSMPRNQKWDAEQRLRWVDETVVETDETAAKK